MLTKINKILTGDILKILCDMGHGDTLAIVDANYPAYTNGQRVIQLPGVNADAFLEAIAPIFPLDHVSEYPARLMDMDPKDKACGMREPELWGIFEKMVSEKWNKKTGKFERKDFYMESKKCYAIIQTGEDRLYGNIILSKGVC